MLLQIFFTIERPSVSEVRIKLDIRMLKKSKKKVNFAHTCSITSGVDIIPPHLVTRALDRELLHLDTSSLSMFSASTRTPGFDT